MADSPYSQKLVNLEGQRPFQARKPFFEDSFPLLGNLKSSKLCN